MIITLGREHGSGGHDVAKALAEKLGYACFDKEIVDHAAENSNFSKEILDTYDEKRVSAFVVATPHNNVMNEGFRLNMQAAAAQFNAIRELAERGNCIFVGRCADYILRGRDDVIKVFIMAYRDHRVNTIMQRKGINQEQARKLIKEVDKDRSSYYRYYTDQTWGEADNYDLCIDSSHIGTTGAVNVISAYIENLK